MIYQTPGVVARKNLASEPFLHGQWNQPQKSAKECWHTKVPMNLKEKKRKFMYPSNILLWYNRRLAVNWDYRCHYTIIPQHNNSLIFVENKTPAWSLCNWMERGTQTFKYVWKPALNRSEWGFSAGESAGSSLECAPLSSYAENSRNIVYKIILCHNEQTRINNASMIFCMKFILLKLPQFRYIILERRLGVRDDVFKIFICD